MNSRWHIGRLLSLSASLSELTPSTPPLIDASVRALAQELGVDPDEARTFYDRALERARVALEGGADPAAAADVDAARESLVRDIVRFAGLQVEARLLDCSRLRASGEAS